MIQNQVVQLNEDPVRAAGFLVDLGSVTFSDAEVSPTSWIQALPLGKYRHPLFGDVNITIERAKRFASNVLNRVRNTDLDVDFDHKQDAAKGSKAAGWIRAAEARADGLWVLVEWTKEAAKEISEGAWKYFSPEFVDEWEHPKSGETFKDVLFGGGITNRPFLKDILPINLSEAFDASAIPTKKGDEVDRKKICQLLGLPEDASDEDILTKTQKLSEGDEAVRSVLKLKESDDPVEAIKALREEPAEEDDDPLSEVVKALGEDSPAAKALSEIIEQNRSLRKEVGDLTTSNREARIAQKLSEVVAKNGKQLTTAQIDDFKEVILLTPASQEERLFKLAEDQAAAAGFKTEQKGGRPPTQLEEDDDPTKKFNDAVQKLLDGNDNLVYGDAVEQVAAQNPQLYSEYRSGSYVREDY